MEVEGRCQWHRRTAQQCRESCAYAGSAGGVGGAVGSAGGADGERKRTNRVCVRWS